MCVGGSGLSRHDDRRFALRVLDTIFGGTSSSRLFQEVREQRGLAYAVYSFTSAYQDTGQVGLYLGTRPDNITEGLAVVASELCRLREEPETIGEATCKVTHPALVCRRRGGCSADGARRSWGARARRGAQAHRRDPRGPRDRRAARASARESRALRSERAPGARARRDLDAARDLARGLAGR